MTIATAKFVRKPFYIDAVQVTEDNLQEVADWCQGDVRTGRISEDRGTGKYVKVRVHHALNERQTKAFVGDWVLYAGTGFKVYTPNAFAKSFDPAFDSPEELRALANLRERFTDIPPLSDNALEELRSVGVMPDEDDKEQKFYDTVRDSIRVEGDTCKHGEPKEFCQDDGATPRDCESVEN